MSDRALVLAALAGLLISTAVMAQQTPLGDGPVTLEEAVGYALNRSPRLASARYAADAAHAERSVRWWSRAPSISLSGLLRTFPIENKLPVDGHMDVPLPSDPSPLDAFRRQFQPTFYDLTATVSLPVFDRQLDARIAAAGHMAEAADAVARAARDELVSNVAATYYHVLRVQQVVSATEASVRSLEESARIVGQRVEVGAAPPIDLYRVRTRLANTRQELIRRAGDLEKAKTSLRAAMGVEDVLQPITLADTLGFTAPDGEELRDLVNRALRQRPDYAAQEEMVEVRGRMARAATAAYLPALSVNGYYKQVYGSALQTWRDDAGVFVRVSLGLLDPVNPARVREAHASQYAEEQRLQSLRLEVIRQVQQAYLDRSEAAQRIRAAEASLQEALEALRIERLRLDAGKGVINDLLDAQAELLQAEVNHANALADYNTARIALQRAVGGIELVR